MIRKITHIQINPNEKIFQIITKENRNNLKSTYSNSGKKNCIYIYKTKNKKCN